MKNRFEFISLKEGSIIEGTFKSFGKNKFGVFMIIKSGKKDIALNIKATVLKTLIKNNLHLFVEGTKIRVEKMAKPKGKNYYDYSVELNDKILESSSSKLEIDEVKNLL